MAKEKTMFCISEDSVQDRRRTAYFNRINGIISPKPKLITVVRLSARSKAKDSQSLKNLVVSKDVTQSDSKSGTVIVQKPRVESVKTKAKKSDGRSREEVKAQQMRLVMNTQDRKEERLSRKLPRRIIAKERVRGIVEYRKEEKNNKPEEIRVKKKRKGTKNLQRLSRKNATPKRVKVNEVVQKIQNQENLEILNYETVWEIYQKGGIAKEKKQVLFERLVTLIEQLQGPYDLGDLLWELNGYILDYKEEKKHLKSNIPLREALYRMMMFQRKVERSLLTKKEQDELYDSKNVLGTVIFLLRNPHFYVGLQRRIVKDMTLSKNLDYLEAVVPFMQFQTKVLVEFFHKAPEALFMAYIRRDDGVADKYQMLNPKGFKTVRGKAINVLLERVKHFNRRTAVLGTGMPITLFENANLEKDRLVIRHGLFAFPGYKSRNVYLLKPEDLDELEKESVRKAMDKRVETLAELEEKVLDYELLPEDVTAQEKFLHLRKLEKLVQLVYAAEVRCRFVKKMSTEQADSYKLCKRKIKLFNQEF